VERTVEASGRTLEEAKNAALRLLGVTDPALVVFEELPDKKGLFNFAYKRVKATVGKPSPASAGVQKESPPASKAGPGDRPPATGFAEQ